jgi:hypothetical protein
MKTLGDDARANCTLLSNQRPKLGDTGVTWFSLTCRLRMLKNQLAGRVLAAALV